MIRKTHALSLAILCASATPTYAFENLTVITSAAYQNKNLSFDQKYSGAANNRAEFSVDLPMLSLGVTTVYKKFFASLKWESNLSDTSTSTSETDRSENLESNLITHPGGTVDVSREDISLTLGYNVWKSLNLFVGYLDGKTKLNPDPFCANPFPVTVSPENPLNSPQTVACSRSNRAFQQFFIGDNPDQDPAPSYVVANQADYEQVYTEQGFYIGGSYGFQIADAGTLSVSLAYASMDGKYKDNANDPNGAFGSPSTFRAFNYEGDSTGTSLALTWTAPLGETSAYTLDLRRQAYSMDGKDQTGNLSDVKLETDEEMVGLTAGVQFYF